MPINVTPEVSDSLYQVCSSLSQDAAAIEEDFSVQINVTPEVVGSLCQGCQFAEPGRCSD